MAGFNHKFEAQDYCDKQKGDLAFKDELIRLELNKKAKDNYKQDVMSQIKAKLEKQQKQKDQRRK